MVPTTSIVEFKRVNFFLPRLRLTQFNSTTYTPDCFPVHGALLSSFFLRYFSCGSSIILRGQEVMFSFHYSVVTEHRVSHSFPFFGHICFQRIYNVNDRMSTASQSVFSNFMPKVVTPKSPEVCGGTIVPSPFPTVRLQPPSAEPRSGAFLIARRLSLPLFILF